MTETSNTFTSLIRNTHTTIILYFLLDNLSIPIEAVSIYMYLIHILNLLSTKEGNFAGISANVTSSKRHTISLVRITSNKWVGYLLSNTKINKTCCWALTIPWLIKYS